MTTDSVLLQWINEARLPAALDELRDCEPIDLRLRHALTGVSS